MLGSQSKLCFADRTRMRSFKTRNLHICFSSKAPTRNRQACTWRVVFQRFLFGEDSEESSWSGWSALCGALEAGGPSLHGAYLSLQRLVMDLPLSRPLWDSNPRPPAYEPTLLPTALSVQLVYRIIARHVSTMLRTMLHHDIAQCSLPLFPALLFRQRTVGSVWH